MDDLLSIRPENGLFPELVRVVKELDRLADQYLGGLPLMDDDEVAERLWTIAHERYPDPEAVGWDNLPAWAEAICDYHVPYYGPPQPGSLGHSLGTSLGSRSAHLRNLLEQAEGRTTQELPFPSCACERCHPEGHVAFIAAVEAEGPPKRGRAPKGTKTPKEARSRV